MDDKGRKQIYLDYNATTPLDGEVLEEIHTTLKDAWGNPSSQHDSGVRARKIITKARGHVADMVGASTNDIIFTSGGTEANNMVLHTAVKYFQDNVHKFHLGEAESTGKQHLPHIITSNMEHDSIKLVLEHYLSNGIADVTYVAATKQTGRVEPEDIMCALMPTTCLVTIMMANNETGIIQPIREIVEHIRAQKSRYHILVHTDAAQAIGKVCVDARDLDVDYITIVGHKFYGPRVGALYVNSPGETTPLYPLLYGGGQERNFRPGTENTGMIAGLGKAAELVVKNLHTYSQQMKEVRDYLEDKLKDTFGKDCIHINGDLDSERLPNTCNVSILSTSLTGSEILERCKHTQASVGAACHSQHGRRASPILLALGIEEDVAIKALRMSVGRETTTADIDIVINDINNAISNTSGRH